MRGEDDPMVPVHLLAFGVQSFVTTVPCLAEMWAWTDRTLAEKQNLSMLYIPYVLLGEYCLFLLLAFRLAEIDCVARCLYGAGYGP